MTIPFLPHHAPVGPPAPSRASKPRLALIRYVGFKCTDAGREYSLQVFGEGDPRLFTFVIPHAAFADKTARFQDAPDLCFAKLQRELAADALPTSGVTCVLTAADLAEYRDAQARRSPERKRRVAIAHS